MERPHWFIALIPDETIAEEVRTYKQYAARHFRAQRALRSPAHITLIPPFFCPLRFLGRMRKTLSDFVAAQKPFDLQLSGFDCFAPRVIFIDVADAPLLMELQRALARCWEQEMDWDPGDRRDFHPHMTIAFKDLTRSRFPEAWAYFREQEYARTFCVEGIWLLRHKDKQWQPFQFFSFGQ